jgi:hypothetical protein
VVRGPDKMKMVDMKNFPGKEISVKNNVLNDNIFSKAEEKYYMVITLVTMRVMALTLYVNESVVN